MKVLARYILSEFFKPFLLSLAGFTVIFLIVQIFNDMRLIMEFKPGPWLTLKYFFFFIPGFAVQITPIACLFGVLFSMGALSRGNELIAMRSGGLDIYQAAIPLALAGLIICGASLIFSEWVVPPSETMKHHTVWVQISKHQEETENSFRQNISMVGIEGGVYHLGSFDGATDRMADIVMLNFDEDKRLKSRLDAQSAQYQDGQWVFFKGYQRTFDAEGKELVSQPFEKLAVTIPEKPSDFLTVEKDPNRMTILELTNYVRQLKHSGSDHHKELTTLYLKLASPFGCVIMIILAVPWGWTMRKYTGAIASFGISALVAFAYIGGMQIGQNLGNSALAPPFLSVWITNVIFAVVGPALMAWKNR